MVPKQFEGLSHACKELFLLKMPFCLRLQGGTEPSCRQNIARTCLPLHCLLFSMLLSPPRLVPALD